MIKIVSKKSNKGKIKQNYEIKTPVNDLSSIKKLTENLKKQHKLKEHCIQKQKDIYYNIGDGRLKLRIIDNKTGTLIRYHRNEKSSKRVSKYSLIVSTDFKNLHKTLSETLGEMVTVDKKREIFVYDNVRIHLDKVKGLGNFLEFEIVFSSMAKAKQQMKTLIKYFGLDEKKFIKNSYSDLLMQNEKK